MNFATALLDAREMGEADRQTVAAGSSVSALMENAGRGVAEEIVRRWPQRRVTVLCGPGNNGGDGFVAACHLAAAGWNIRVALLGSRVNLKDAARFHAEKWRGSIEALTPECIGSVAKDTLAAASAQRIPIVAVDIPSGVQGDTGENLGAVNSVLTVTCFRKKPGHLLCPGRGLCGELVITDIGTPMDVLDEIAPKTFENDPGLWLAALPRPRQDGNKYTRGHA